MKITFPHFGNTYITARSIFEGFGVEYVAPPLCSKEALEIGSFYSPEEICLPFKIQMGNYIQAIEKGADTVIITGSCGPCRFGEYCEMQMNLLRKIGHNIDFIVLDYPKDIGKDELLNRLSKISNASSKTNWEKIMAAVRGLKITNLLDEIEGEAHYKCGYEANIGECKKILMECRREMNSTIDPCEVLKKLIYYKKKIREVKIDKNKNPIKIALIGEIYTIIEPFSNMYIEDRLMDYGVSVKKKLTPSWWVKNAALSVIKLDNIDIKRASRDYLNLCIGGHGRECIGEAVLAKKQGMDGAIQIFPLGCMPEIVSKSILPTISRDKNLPILTLVVDEMTGEAGYLTRVEAFLDLLERRKENVLFGS